MNADLARLTALFGAECLVGFSFLVCRGCVFDEFDTLHLG